MLGVVQEMNPSKSGNSQRLKLNGKWYVANWKVNLDGVQKGTHVEYETGSFKGNDGKDVETIATIRPAPSNGAAQSAPATPQTGSTICDGDILRSVSNVVGNACAAGTIKSPAELKAWFDAAYAGFTFMGAKEAPPKQSHVMPDFDDSAKLGEDMPDKFYENLPPQTGGSKW